MKKNFTLIALFTLLGQMIHAQNPNPALIGYWHNWAEPNAPYIQLDQIDSRYNIVNIAFAIPKTGSDYDMEFIPDQVTAPVLITRIQTLQSQGKKVNISIGGGNNFVSLDNTMERDTFVSSMLNIINTFGFDGMDIDLENVSLSISGGTISAPIDQPIINLVDAVKLIMQTYYTQHNKRLILTMAPETAYVQGGMSSYAGVWGAYLPVIYALRDSLEILHVQLYNSGTQFGLDSNLYSEGTADFIVAMTESVIQGFNTNGGIFPGLPANKVAVGLLACSGTGDSGFIDTATVKNAIDYLRGNGPQPGTYTLINTNGYQTLRGMMTWSINWDAVSTCSSIYEYAENFEDIFGTSAPVSTFNSASNPYELFPNPANQTATLAFDNPIAIGSKKENCTLTLYDIQGQLVQTITNITTNKVTIETKNLTSGLYFLQLRTEKQIIATGKLTIE